MVSVPDHTLDNVPLQDEDCIEYRMLMVYAQRVSPNHKFQDLQRKKKKDGVASNGEGHGVGDGSSLPPKKEKKKKKKKVSHWLTPKCLRGQKDDDGPVFRSLGTVKSPENAEDEQVGRVVQRAMDIVQDLQRRDQKGVGFRGLRREPSVQPDGDGKDDLIEELVAILRAEGDKLNDQIRQDQSFLQSLRTFFCYNLFEKVTESYVEQMVPASAPEEVQQSSRIALCLHATTRLTALDIHPMSRMFGAQYLKDNYSRWAMEHGGWENVMQIPVNQEEESEEELKED